jgi:dihydrofolate reductase
LRTIDVNQLITAVPMPTPRQACQDGRVEFEAYRGELVAYCYQRDVIITGSLSVVHTLMAGDLIDEYRLLTFPTIAGAGQRLFPAGGRPTYLETLSVEQVGAAVLTRYGRSADPPTFGPSASSSTVGGPATTVPQHRYNPSL